MLRFAAHRRSLSGLVSCSIACLASFIATCALAVPPSDQLLPDTTSGYVTVPSLDALSASWNETQFGQLMADPQMQTFADDLLRQLKEKWSQAHQELGLTWDEVREVVGGELSMARVRGSDGKSALTVLVDVTGRGDAATALIDKMTAKLIESGAKRTKEEVAGVELVVLALPRLERDDRDRQAIYFIHQDVLCATDNLSVATALIGRFGGDSADSLAAHKPYRAVMDRCQAMSGDLAPEVRWFLAPIAFAIATREALPPLPPRPGDRRPNGARGDGDARKTDPNDIINILKNQGFEGIQGVGGHLNFNVEERYQVLNRVAIHAPPPYQLAMRMLKLPNSNELAPHDWVPAELAKHTAGCLDVPAAFEAAATLVDAVLGEEGVFEDLLDSIKNDPDGPGIDIRQDLIAKLGNRLSVLTDYELPITTTSERILVGVRIDGNPQEVAATIERAMQNDPTVRKRSIAGHDVWEMFEDEAPELELAIENPLGQGGGGPGDDDEEPLLPNSAITVANNHLLVATHIDMLEKVLTPDPRRDLLINDVDFIRVTEEMQSLGAAQNCLRVFARTDEDFRPTYELVKAGKMPESQTMLGKALNRLMGQGPEDEPRKPKLDASKLPDFELVRRYLGPSGTFVTSEFGGENQEQFEGWVITNFVLPKE